jgi:xylose dehydrogenase (NAD/NADP)
MRKDSSAISWGVLSASRIGDEAVIPALLASRMARPVAIASKNADRARAMAKRHGIQTVHDDYLALLENPAIDVVYVPLVNSLHKSWAMQALIAGKHVLCEKPLALNASEAIEMAEAASRADRLLMEGLMYRFHRPLQEFVSSIERPEYVNAAFSFPLDSPDDFRLRAELGGGSLLDLGPYVVDLIRWIIGADPCEIGAVVDREGIDRSALAALRFAAGPFATVWTSFTAAEFQCVDVYSGSTHWNFDRPFTPWRAAGAAFTEGLAGNSPYVAMVEAFSEAVVGHLEAPVPLADSIANLRVLDAIAQGPRLKLEIAQ